MMAYPPEGYREAPGGGIRELEAAVARLEAVSAFHLDPTDFERVRREGIPEIEMLLAPYIPKGASVQIVGPTEVAKSMWAQHQTALASRLGMHVVYVQGENPFPVEFSRWERLNPDHERFTHYDAVGRLDLSDPASAAWFLEVADGADMVTIDTWSSFWPGEDNEATLEFERRIVGPIKASGTTLVVIHHEGFAQPFSKRGGATAGRGGSAQGQKFDVVLDFDPGSGTGEFIIVHGKGGRFSPGGVKEPDRRFRVVDTDDGGLDIEALGEHVPEGMLELAAHLLQEIREQDGARVTTRRYLTEVARQLGHGGKDTVATALDFLRRSEDVIVRKGVRIVASDGKERTGDLWSPRADEVCGP